MCSWLAMETLQAPCRSNLSLASSLRNQAKSERSPGEAGDPGVSSSKEVSEAQAKWAKANISSIFSGAEISSRILLLHSSVPEAEENWTL